MTIRVRLHAIDPSTTPSPPIATLVLADMADEPRSYRADDRSSGPRFALRAVDGDDRSLARRIEDSLRQDSVRISRSSSSIANGIRTRGDSFSDEPYGTATYWRAAVGQLESTMGLRADLSDWSAMLRAMDEAGHLQQDVRRVLEWHQGSPVALAREVLARVQSGGGTGALALERPTLFAVARELVRSGWTSRDLGGGKPAGAQSVVAQMLQWALEPAEMSRFAWLLLVATIGLTVVQWSVLPSRPAPAVDVVYGAVLSASGERGPRPADDFDRLRVPPGTTALQLTVPIGESSRDERLVAEIEALDDTSAGQPSATVIESSPAGVAARVVLPVPPDGDYLLRLRRLAEVGGEVVVTRGFRVTHQPAPAGRP